MKKFYIYLSIAVMAICIAACGDKKNSDGPNSATLEVEADLGALSNYVTTSESEITLKLVDDGIQGSVGLNVTKAFEGQSAWDLELEVEVLDENHISVAELGTIEFEHPFSENVVNAGNKHLEIKIDSKDIWEKIKNEGKFISIKFNRASDEISPYSGSMSSSNDDDSSSSYSSSNDDDNDDDDDSDSYSSSSSSDSQDWDALLNSYEQYVDKYVSYMKKAAKGDMNAMSEYPALAEKAQEFNSKLEGAKGNMSTSQWSRYMKITAKMTKAMQEIH